MSSDDCVKLSAESQLCQVSGEREDQVTREFE